MSQQSGEERLIQLVNDYFQQEKGNKVTDYNFPNFSNKVLQLYKEEIKKKDNEIKELKSKVGD